MFEELSEKLDGVLGKFRSRGLLTEAQVRDGLREVRRILLEADVNFKLVKDFLTRVEEKALGEKVLKSVAPGQQIVKIVHDELIALLGDKPDPLKVAAQHLKLAFTSRAETMLHGDLHTGSIMQPMKVISFKTSLATDGSISIAVLVRAMRSAAIAVVSECAQRSLASAE